MIRNSRICTAHPT